MDEKLYKVHELIDKGIDELVSKSSLDKESVCIMGELIDIKKDLSTIEAMEEYGYSEMNDPYNGGVSYARGGGRGSRYGYRGNYNNYGYRSGGNSYRRGNYERGYSNAGEKDMMIEHLERAMDNASNEHEREKIRKMIMQIEQD